MLSGQKTWSTRATYADRAFGLNLAFEDAPLGLTALRTLGSTVPDESFARAKAAVRRSTPKVAARALFFIIAKPQKDSASTQHSRSLEA